MQVNLGLEYIWEICILCQYIQVCSKAAQNKLVMTSDVMKSNLTYISRMQVYRECKKN